MGLIKTFLSTIATSGNPHPVLLTWDVRIRKVLNLGTYFVRHFFNHFTVNINLLFYRIRTPSVRVDGGTAPSGQDSRTVGSVSLKCRQVSYCDYIAEFYKIVVV